MFSDAKNLAPLPLGTSAFETLRERGQIYVDKTGLIYKFASKSEKFFLTRPRRFGKSLLVSTLASLFSKGVQYFSGLAIEKLWKDKTYRVVEIDFSEVKNFIDFEDFRERLGYLLIHSFERAGFQYDACKTEDAISQVSLWLKGQEKNSLVLLIDEYDAPHTACLESEELFQKIRSLLASFYAVVKANDACWRFVFVTGITKFNQTGIFSELNTFTDISLFPEFASLLGYSEEDIQCYFGGYVSQAARALDVSEEVLQKRMREYYDGYCFDAQISERVYAPWSVLNFLSWPTHGFENYWTQSGGSLTLLQKYLHSHSLKAPESYAVEKEISHDELTASTDFAGINDVVLLTQAGYLTLKRRSGRFFYVSYPNKEVADSLAALYTDMLLKDHSLEFVGAGRLPEALQEGNVDLLFDQANHAFAGIDSVHHPITEEKHCQAFLQIFISGAGFSATVENHGALGRSDLEVDVRNFHWIFELKFLRVGGDSKGLLEEAAKQIISRNYGATTFKKRIRVAAVFSEEKRQFVCWKRL